jgi:hypothetical protein
MITYVQFQFKKCFSLGSIVHELWEEQFIHFPIGHRAKLCLKVVAISDRYKQHSIGKRPPKDHSHHLNIKLLSSCWTIELWGSANQIVSLTVIKI